LRTHLALADLIIIDRDSPEQIRDAKVLRTITAGKTVFQLAASR
jgi:predicted amidohydrolase YtcJ